MFSNIGSVFKRLNRIVAYIITPLMLALIAWLSDNTMSLIQNLNPSIPKFSIFLIALTLAFIFFTYTILANIRKSHVKETSVTNINNFLHYVKSFSLIIMYFTLTLAIGTLISIISTWVKGHETLILQSDNFLLISVLSSTLLIFFDRIISPDGFNSRIRKIALFNYIIIVMYILFFAIDLSFLFWIKVTNFILITIYSIYLFFAVTRSFVRPYNDLVAQQLPQKKHLILFLSCLNSKQLSDWQNFAQNILSNTKNKDNNTTSLNHLANSLNKLSERNPWVMVLKGISYHLDNLLYQNQNMLNEELPCNGALKELTIFTSQSSDGRIASITQVHELTLFLKRYCELKNKPINVQLVVNELLSSNTPNYKRKNITEMENNPYESANGINFGEFDETNDALNIVLRLPEVKNIGYENTVIDVTGGQKTTSVAGALASTVLDISNQYVDTNKTYITGYDFQYVDPTKAG